MTPQRDAGTDADVVIVGHGPVGQTLALLLADAGWRVVVLERQPRPYPLPRATSFDGETARTFALIGLGPALARIGEAADGYDWRTAAGRTLIGVDFAGTGRFGWPDVTTMHQPALESALRDAGAQRPGIEVRRGWTVTGVTQAGVVTCTTGTGVATVSGSWVVGCDGANSTVRAALGASVTDLGFAYDWLLCDVLLSAPRTFSPTNVQICDPARPTTVVASGPGRRRWEFMRLPVESLDELGGAGTAWQLLKAFDVRPDNATLERHTVYRFRAAWADRWRRGRVLLAGDAAHTMPPFTGQGMCAGIRDVRNLAWKLDLVLRGKAPESIMDTYEQERLPHVRAAVDTAVALGRIVCVTDEAAATRRDAALTGTSRSAAPLPVPLAAGLLDRPLGAVAPPVGEPVPQGRVTRGPDTGLFDQIAGAGFIVLSIADPGAALTTAHHEFLRAIGARIVVLSPSGGSDPDALVDTDGTYLGYLRAARARFLIVRPDHIVFGAARTSAQLPGVIDRLRAQLNPSGEGADDA
ncbi:bifunctional 3-(3-hydroxy-phenyl)propionate/3-hydroxycinnamic acid hydroxylase [Actinoplanes sp. N902-109]|uniref:bifunctional 3-(3-hydroxy-phenyl)propionate/3-hydroxycinnamic acid hydroxylase MhpA n=1 Tax=Actinoplanes sp. (strain N902-109) TaxID=649831 RepID=UPI0003294A90|nr:bifunctional 3-(3-hydroxy-phenyl)propionate/3-hydroxycinnamic acid hydroxylase [Actinoplanes sp. N902-109]AGL16398.1 FAD-binding monooxygenase [Actinoplanes sp. N902-109]